MYKQNISSLARAYREEHTSTTLKRSTNIENCLPDGYMRLVHSVALATSDGKAKTIAEIRNKFNESLKGSKEIMINLGALTAQPFPLVESAKKQGIQSNDYVNSPLYDISTGVTVEERYATANMSDLGKLLTRHYLNKSVAEVDYYNSIVPTSLLRRAVPWSLGYRSETYPMNPKELFQIMVEMMKNNSPIVSPEFLEKTFRGFDLGDDYIIFMKKEALLELYTSGTSSFIVIPKIEINRDTSEIVIKVPPIDRTSKAIVKYFVEQFKSGSKYTKFKYDPEVKFVGKSIILNVTHWYGSDAEILREFLEDNVIATRKYTNNVTLRYLDKEIKTQEDAVLGKAKPAIKLQDYPPFSTMDPEKLGKLTSKQIQNLMEKNKTEIKDDSDADYSFMDLTYHGDDTTGDKVGRNPYSYAIDKAPVWEILWECIIGERQLQRIGIEEELKSLNKKLQFDLLYEKASRPEVAKVIHKFAPLPRTRRINSLLDATKPGSEVLEEGFSRWEVEEIYKASGNEILGKLFDRDLFKDRYITTLEKIKLLKEKLENDSLIDKDIIQDLNRFIQDPKYNRKSQVLFLKDASITKTYGPQPNHTWDQEDVPVTIYHDGTQMIRVYGVNMYVNSFNPTHEIATTNKSSLALLRRTTTQEVKVEPFEVSTVSRITPVKFPQGTIGIIPMFEETPIMVWTNKGRYFKYERVIMMKLEFEPDEFMVGWVPLTTKYLDFITPEYVQTVDADKTLCFYKTKMNRFGGYLHSSTDIYPKEENDNIVRVPVNIDDQFGTYYKPERKILKTFQAQPVPISRFAVPYGAEHITYYVNGMLITNPLKFGYRENQYHNNKRVWVKEGMPIEGMNDETSQKVYEIYDKVYTDIRMKQADGYKFQQLKYISTPRYDSYKPTKEHLKFIIDPRIAKERGGQDE